MHTQVNGISIAYSDRGTGLPIVFLHAFPLKRTMWAHQEEALSLRFRINTVDLRGHGESDAPLWRYTQEQSADDVNVLLGQLSIQQAIFAGLSMACYILFARERIDPGGHEGSGRHSKRNRRALPDGADGLQKRIVRHRRYHESKTPQSPNYSY